LEADRDDKPPPGLLEAGQKDIDTVFDRLERMLRPRPQPWPFHTPGVVECAWFANLAALRTFGLAIELERFPAVMNWFKAMRTHPVFVADAKRTAAFLKDLKHLTHERKRLFWSCYRADLTDGLWLKLMPAVRRLRRGNPAQGTGVSSASP
jgi:hypothetical protein